MLVAQSSHKLHDMATRMLQCLCAFHEDVYCSLQVARCDKLLIGTCNEVVSDKSRQPFNNSLLPRCTMQRAGLPKPSKSRHQYNGLSFAQHVLASIAAHNA